MHEQQVRRPNRGEKGRVVAEILAMAIRDGQFAPGERLVESRLAGALGISRGTLREAFRHMSAEGLVELMPNCGAQVRRLTLVEVIELFDIRRELEALAAGRAAARMVENRVRDKFEQACRPIWCDAPRISATDYVVENQHFHSAIYAAAGNRQLKKLNETLQLSLIMVQTRQALTKEVLAASVAEHRVIATAIRDGDGAAAGLGMRNHLRRAAEFVRALPPDMFAAPRAETS